MAVTISGVVVILIVIVLGILWARRRARRQALEEYEDGEFFDEIISPETFEQHQERHQEKYPTSDGRSSGFIPYPEDHDQTEQSVANYSRTSRSTSWARGYFSPLW